MLNFLKLESRKLLTVAILARFLLVPAFYFTAKYGDQGWMILLTSFLGLSNGYLTVCILTSAPKGYKVRPSGVKKSSHIVVCLFVFQRNFELIFQQFIVQLNHNFKNLIYQNITSDSITPKLEKNFQVPEKILRLSQFKKMFVTI